MGIRKGQDRTGWRDREREREGGNEEKKLDCSKIEYVSNHRKDPRSVATSCSANEAKKNSIRNVGVERNAFMNAKTILRVSLITD